MGMMQRIKELFEDIKEQLKFNQETSGRKPLMYLAAGVGVFAVVCIVIGILSAGGSNRAHPVYINEVLASNTRYPNADGVCCDYVELYNSAGYPVDISGFCLTDGGNSTRYEFPSGTVIGAHEYLVVYCDKLAESSSYARFGISRGGGEMIYLLNSNGAVSDSLVTVETSLNEAMIRKEDGVWGVSPQATPGEENDETAQAGQALHNAELSPVRISEFMSDNSGYANEEGLFCDWVELYNTADHAVDISGFSLSDNVGVDKFIFPEGTVIAPRGYLVINCTTEEEGDMIAPFGLSQLGEESVVFKNGEGRIVDIVDSVALQTNESLALGSDGVWARTKESSPGFENSTAGYEAYLQAIGVGRQTVLISELMAAGQTILADTYGQFPDWVELCNVSGETVNLKGWFLSDDPEKPTKWEFPSVELLPNQRIVVFCSGKDGYENGQLHTNFSLAASGESVVLSSPLGVAVHSITYGRGQEEQSFIYDTNAGELFSTEYPTPGYSNDTAGYEQFCAANVAKGPLAIWEVMTSNDWYLAQELGDCYDWVEIRNISDAPVNLSEYSITDDVDAPGLYTLPDKTLAAGESICIILSGDESLSTAKYDHAGFTLSVKEDRLFLFHNGSELLDYVLLRQIPQKYSYGRSDSTGGFFYMEPTPKKENNSGYRMISQMPASDVESGVYIQNTSVDVTFSAAGAVYYTTDGSDPDVNSLRYEGPVHIDETTVLRAIAVEDGKLQSSIYTSTFVFEDRHTIPVVSLVTDPDNLWSSTGIYKDSWDTKEMKKPAHISYTGEDGTFSIDCEISMHGMTSLLAQDKKSFTVRFQDSYAGPLNYDIFEDGEVTRYASILLRADQEDVYSTYIRDNLFGNLAAEYCDTVVSMRNKYISLYLNGEYWGIYSIREHHSVEHYASQMEVPLSSVTMLKSYARVGTGLYPYFLYCKNNDLSKQENYDYIASHLDVTSFADWTILEAYSGNFDIYGNMRYYYSEADGLWRCGLTDLDLSLFDPSKDFGDMKYTLHHSVFVSALYENEGFQDLIAKRLAELLAGPMSDENMIARIESMAAQIRDELPLEKERWGGKVSRWERMVDDLKDFCDGRAKTVINSLCSTLNFTKEEKQAYFGDLLAQMQ